MWHWSADTLFWQVAIDLNMDFQYQRGTLHVSVNLLARASLAAILQDSITIIVVMRIRSQAIPLAMTTWENQFMDLLLISYMGMGLRLEAKKATNS